MKRSFCCGKAMLPMFFLLFSLSAASFASTEIQDLIDLPVEVHDNLKSKLEDSKEYTEEQLESITRCLRKGDVKSVVNCLSDDGLDDAVAIGYMIRDEMSNLKDKVCGGEYLEQDRCDKLRKDVKNLGSKMKTWGNQLKEKWSKTVSGGKAYLEKRYELTRLKKKICDRINQKGCWSWLNERLDIHCKPAELGNDAEKLKKCRTRVAQDVWNRLEARQ